ncbi:MAG: flagellar hook-basal body complex protein FliE [Clostridium butyricum]|nr:flagellar hook-basal body complex protein FliE [Clostridium butyricum]
MRIENKFNNREILFNNKFQLNSNDEAKGANNTSFADVLKKTINDTNDKLVQADTVTNAFIKGADVNIDEVMIKNQEANLCLQFLTQTRDKLLEGYDTLSKLQL